MKNRKKRKLKNLTGGKPSYKLKKFLKKILASKSDPALEYHLTVAEGR